MKPLTLQEAKDQVAIKYGFFNWLNLEARFSRSVQDTDKLMAVYYDEAAELYKTSALESKEREIEELEQKNSDSMKACKIYMNLVEELEARVKELEEQIRFKDKVIADLNKLRKGEAPF